jgi:hypothetical protein
MSSRFSDLSKIDTLRHDSTSGGFFEWTAQPVFGGTELSKKAMRLS